VIQILRFLARYARRHVPQYLVGFVFLFLTNWALVRIPRLIGDALNLLSDGGPEALGDARWIALELMLWAIAVVPFRTLSRVLFFNPGRDIEYQVGNDLFGHLLQMPRVFYQGRRVGELVSVATNDTQSVRLLVGFAGLQVCNVLVAIPLHLFQMLRTDWVLTLWCIGPVALGAVWMRLTIRQFYAKVRASLEYLARLSDRILETYAGVGTIRAHGSEAAAQERFAERNDHYLSLMIDIAKIRAFSMPVLALSGLVSTGIVLWVGGGRVIDGNMQVGDMATFTTLLLSAVGLLTSLAWVLAAIGRGAIAVDRVESVLSTEPAIPEATERRRLLAPPRLEIRDLTFVHPGADEPSLQGVSAVVEPGRTLGIFGRTGAGKTTLIELLAHVYSPPAGAVRLDDDDLRDLDRKLLLEDVAVVPQEPFLFSTSLRDNIRLTGERTGHLATADAQEDHVAQLPGVARLRGATPPEDVAFEAIAATAAPDPELTRVLRATALEEDVRQLPHGLDTTVGERGVMLSGGQRQRTALARALYRQPRLLLLDDVLSAVDQRTEARLVEAIRQLTGGDGEDTRPPTTVIVSHRTSVLEHADEILVLEGGRVAERGTHAQLVAAGGHYAEAHEHQVRAAAGEEEEA